jgi:serine/threonine protein kinase
MEFVEGSPLRGPLPLDTAREYALQIVDALDAAHRKGIMHRDLKPENIFATAAGIKLLDFGLAKFFNIDAAAETQAVEFATQAGLIVGTVAVHVARASRGRRLDERSDVFSFGTVLYELLAVRDRSEETRRRRSSPRCCATRRVR